MKYVKYSHDSIDCLTIKSTHLFPLNKWRTVLIIFEMNPLLESEYLCDGLGGWIVLCLRIWLSMQRYNLAPSSQIVRSLLVTLHNCSILPYTCSDKLKSLVVERNDSIDISPRWAVICNRRRSFFRIIF